MPKRGKSGGEGLPRDYIPYSVSQDMQPRCVSEEQAGMQSRLRRRQRAPTAMQTDWRGRRWRHGNQLCGLFALRAGNAETHTTAVTMKMERRGCDDVFLQNTKSLVTKIEGKFHEDRKQVIVLTVLPPPPEPIQVPDTQLVFRVC